MMVIAFVKFSVSIMYLRESSFQNIWPRRFLRSESHSHVGFKKRCQSSKYESDLGQITRNVCSKLNRESGQSGNQQALGCRRNKRGGGNQVRGRAYNASMNVVEAAKDSSIVTGTFSLNDHFATVLFDSGADFSFISTKFAPILNMKPSIANPGYVIEIPDGKKVKVDRIIRGCKLELGSSLFTIDLIPLGHSSFDVIVGID
ncbi:reverse transcriptase domain-containing protein, partial [Tanacetum coccineum]